MKLIVGLGNIGPKFVHTRHNIGFMVVDTLADGEWRDEPKLEAATYRQTIAGQEVLLAKPTTMMNSSGQAVGKLAQFYRIAPEDIWIIYDELDLPLGRLKISTGSSDNGHNGLISISTRLGHNRFWRFRVGVDTRQFREIPGLEYVLQPLNADEQPQVDQSIQFVAQAVMTALESGLHTAMQAYNKTAAGSPQEPSA